MPTKEELEARLNEDPTDNTTLDVLPPRTEKEIQRILDDAEEKEKKLKEAKEKASKKFIRRS
jgi:hypothetical protein